ncbi:MAG TPA: hypothetical protein VKB90_13665 [Candidatus Acidoferrum sp.]|nr:hypothetical protein [Candidatus Acidoferrum sp.]
MESTHELSAGGDMGVTVTPPLVVYALVRLYYRRRDADKPNLETGSASAATSEHQEIK